MCVITHRSTKTRTTTTTTAESGECTDGLQIRVCLPNQHIIIIIISTSCSVAGDDGEKVIHLISVVQGHLSVAGSAVHRVVEVTTGSRSG